MNYPQDSQDWPLDSRNEFLPSEPRDYIPPGEPEGKSLFKLEAFKDIAFGGHEEWNVKGIIPSQGLIVPYGPSGCGKSFIIFDLALRIARGNDWAGRRVKQGAVCYIAAEGAAGFRKRITAYKIVYRLEQESPPFYLISESPNLGTEQGDLARLCSSIEMQELAAPLRLIVIDTLSQVLHGAEENGSGMMALIGNANALAQRFKCAVVIIHHSGKNVENGSRGHSSLPAAADVVWSVKKDEAQGISVVTVEKAKDEIGGLAFNVKLKRVVLAEDEEGDEISSLVVESITEAEGAKPKKATGKPKPPPSANLLMACVSEALGAKGRDMRPFADGPLLRAVSEACVRDVYYKRVADKEPNTIRTAFWRGIKNALDRQDLVASEVGGERFIWLP
jgi:hypothetical protein